MRRKAPFSQGVTEGADTSGSSRVVASAGIAKVSKEKPQFALGPQIERNREHDNAAANHLKEAEAAKNLRVRNGYIEAAVSKE